jgi:GntR family transcriptional regulator
MLIQVLNSLPANESATTPDPVKRVAVAPCNRASPIPLYSQVRETLRTRINDGTYRQDEQIPSEHELVDAFGVSRITVRQALNDLHKEGLLYKIHGKGTFVSRTKAVQKLSRLEGFGEAMAALGHETHSRVLGHRVVRPGYSIASRLALPAEAELMEIRRVRCLNRAPLSLDVTYVPLEIGRRLVRADLQRRDIFLILENDYGYRLDRAELRIEATLADSVMAEALVVPEGAPVLRIERLTFAQGGKPIDFENLYYRGDAFQYFMSVNRRNEFSFHVSGGRKE